MFGIGPTEFAFFLVILLLAVGPDRLPTFMRTVGKGVRQVRNASREFKDAIGLDELMREGDPFRAPPVRPPQARSVPVQKEAEDSTPPVAEPSEPPVDSPKPAAQPPKAATAPPPPPAPPPLPPAAVSAEPEPAAEGDAPTEAKRP